MSGQRGKKKSREYGASRPHSSSSQNPVGTKSVGTSTGPRIEEEVSMAESSHGSGSSSQRHYTSMEEIPRSVRNAAPELRAAIRRRQNSESAKRCRERKKAEEGEVRSRIKYNSERIHRLERQVDSLAQTLKEKRRKAAERRSEDIHLAPRDDKSGPGSSSKNNLFGDPF